MKKEQKQNKKIGAPLMFFTASFTLPLHFIDFCQNVISSWPIYSGKMCFHVHFASVKMVIGPTDLTVISIGLGRNTHRWHVEETFGESFVQIISLTPKTICSYCLMEETIRFVFMRKIPFEECVSSRTWLLRKPDLFFSVLLTDDYFTWNPIGIRRSVKRSERQK